MTYILQFLERTPLILEQCFILQWYRTKLKVFHRSYSTIIVMTEETISEYP